MNSIGSVVQSETVDSVPLCCNRLLSDDVFIYCTCGFYITYSKDSSGTVGRSLQNYKTVTVQEKIKISM